MQTTDKISDLIDRFERNLDEHKAGRYNEAQVRRKFIDPFFKALVAFKVPLSKGGFRGLSGSGGIKKHNPLTPFNKGE